MKKTFFAFATLLFLSFAANFGFAQATVNTITVNNQTNCNLWAQPYALDLNCDFACSGQGVVVNANSSANINFACSSIDALANGFFTIVGIADFASGNGIKVGNGCGVNLTGTIVDCQGFTRTVSFIAPNTVSIQ
jgi:hypothetical protein